MEVISGPIKDVRKKEIKEIKLEHLLFDKILAKSYFPFPSSLDMNAKSFHCLLTVQHLEKTECIEFKRVNDSDLERENYLWKFS